MKIVFYYFSMSAGGAERTIALLSNYLATQGEQVSILTMNNKPSFYALHPDVIYRPLDSAASSSNIFQSTFHNINAIQVLHSTLKQENPDIVICFGPNGILQAWLARRGMRYRIIGSERNNPYLTHRGFWGKQKKTISKLCEGFIFQTAGAKAYYPLEVQRRSLILSNSLEPMQFSKLQRPWTERKNICAVGRLTEQKCFKDMLVAFAAVQKHHPEAHLDLYGDGELRQDLEAISKELKLSVTFHGRCSKILEAYAQHKIFVSSSLYEGIPNVLMEALASGCACVATNCDFGPSDLITEGQNGFLVPVHDTIALADRLCSLLEDDELAQNFSKKAVSILQTHSLEKIGKEFYSYLQMQIN